MFGTPSQSASLPLNDLQGEALIFLPTEVVNDIETVHGKANAVRATVIIASGATAGEVYADSLIFPKILQSAIRNDVGTGKPVLGKLGKGQAKPGKNAPWTLEEVSDAATLTKATEIYRAYEAQHATADTPF